MGGDAHTGGSIGSGDAGPEGDRASAADVTSRRATLQGAAAAAALGITSMTLPSAAVASSHDEHTAAAVYPVIDTITGGPTIDDTYDDGTHRYRTLTFTSGGTFRVNSLGDADLNTIEYLVVGGGGGGGSGWNRNGGGGAGGLVVQGTATLAGAGASYSVTVGGGGRGGTRSLAPQGGGASSLQVTEDGGGTTSITAEGGGHGGSNIESEPGSDFEYTKIAPEPGGGDCNEPTAGRVQTARDPFGFGGGTAQGGNVFAAGGGGGAAGRNDDPSGDGSNATTSAGGAGGAGVLGTLTGDLYGGGGGGGFQNTGGGTGARGAGRDGGGDGGLYLSGVTTDLDGKDADVNTGGGGGGGTHDNFADNGTFGDGDGGDGGAGAAGIVVVRYRTGAVNP